MQILNQANHMLERWAVFGSEFKGFAACKLNIYRHYYSITIPASCRYPINKIIKVIDRKSKTKTDSWAVLWIQKMRSIVNMRPWSYWTYKILLVIQCWSIIRKAWLLQLQTTISAPTNCCPLNKWVNKSTLEQSLHFNDDTLNPTIRSLSLPWQNYTLYLMTKQRCAKQVSYSDKRAACWTYARAFSDGDQQRDGKHNEQEEGSEGERKSRVINTTRTVSSPIVPAWMCFCYCSTQLQSSPWQRARRASLLSLAWAATWGQRCTDGQRGWKIFAYQ